MIKTAKDKGEEKSNQQSITSFFTKGGSTSQLFSTIGSGKKSINKNSLKLKKGSAKSQGRDKSSERKEKEENSNKCIQETEERKTDLCCSANKNETVNEHSGFSLFSTHSPPSVDEREKANGSTLQQEFKTPVGINIIARIRRATAENEEDIIPPTPSPVTCHSVLRPKLFTSSRMNSIKDSVKSANYTKLKNTVESHVENGTKKKLLSPNNADNSIVVPTVCNGKLSFLKPKCSGGSKSSSIEESSCKDSNIFIRNENTKQLEEESPSCKTSFVVSAGETQSQTKKKPKLFRKTTKQSPENDCVDAKVASDKVGTPILAPRKIVMTKSKAKSLKRRAPSSTGVSPVNKKHQPDVSLTGVCRETVKSNLFTEEKNSSSKRNTPGRGLPESDADITKLYCSNIGKNTVNTLITQSTVGTDTVREDSCSFLKKRRNSLDRHQGAEKQSRSDCADSDTKTKGGYSHVARGRDNNAPKQNSSSRKENGVTPPKTSKLQFNSPSSGEKNNMISLMKTPTKSSDGSPGYSRHVITEMALVTPNKSVLDTSVDSLMDVELGGLLDGVEWSPVTKTTTPIRSKSSIPELSSQSTQPYSPNTTPYGRYLVLEVYRREAPGEGVIPRYGRAISEKVLRMLDESQSLERHCFLREDWENTEVEPGDIVHITGEFHSGVCTLDNRLDHYITVHPDTLVSGTTIAGATRCLRRSILNERFRTEDTNEAMLMGTLLHDLFDRAMKSEEFSKDSLLSTTRELLQQHSYLEGFYGLGMTETEVLDKVKEFMPAFSDWARKYVRAQPDPDLSLMDYKDASVVAPQADQPSVCVSELRDIEENVWSPRFGLKGKVDATVEVRIDRRPRMRRHRPDTAEQISTAVVPLELKTGKLFSKLGSVEHRAQVILYTLLLSDRYRHAIDTGLLYYMKSGHTIGVPALVHEKRALVMKRNEVARYLTLNRTSGGRVMPGMLQDPHTCSRCSQAQNCSVFHKSLESGDHVTSGMGDVFTDLTKHLTHAHCDFFADWFKLVCLEGKEMQQSSKSSQHNIWTVKAWDREKLGQCFSGMVLSSSEAFAGNHGKFLHRFERKADHPSQFSLVDVPITAGDRVVVTEEHCNLIAIATGYVREVQDDFVDVTLERNLASCCNGPPYEDQDLIFRLDKDEGYSSLTSLWSNVAKLFNKNSERDAQLRRLIIDLEPPIFAHSRQALLNFGSSQSSVGSSQTQSTAESTPKYRDQAVEDIVRELNPDQRRAVLRSLSAEDYALILGMPGTGKTTTISCLVRVLVASGKSVLLTSYTHTAVDNILLKLKEAGVDFLRLGQTQKVLPEIQPFTTAIAGAHIKTVNQLNEFYESKIVVATTCLGVNQALFSKRSFDYCIVDEASQITQPVCLGPLRHARVFILVGDHYQLPPLVQSLQAREGGMDVSLFKRLSEYHPQAVVSLEHQYRMHENIMTLSNTLIYGDRLKCGTPQIARELLDIPQWDELRERLCSNGSEDNWLITALDPKHPVVFLNTDAVPAQETHSGRLVSNEVEAILVQHLACALLRGGVTAGSIGIISPYRHQLKQIRQLLSSDTSQSCNELEINTVDKYQGRDKPCILVSLVRSNDADKVGELLKDWRRVNVAVTRAKRKLILIGSLATLKASLLLNELLELLLARGWVQELPGGADKLNTWLTGQGTQSQ